MAEQDRPGVDELKTLVRNTTDVNELRSMLEAEDRTTARDAIERRIQEIEAAEAPVELVDDDGAVFSREELLSGAAGFGATAEDVAGALHLAGRSSMTRSEAAEAVRAFQEREV